MTDKFVYQPDEKLELIHKPDTELATAQGDELVNPTTGELIPIGDVPKLADAVQQIRDYRERLNDALAVFTDALVQESVRQGTRTLTAEGLKVTVSADSEIEWDIELLREGLTAAGLPEGRLNQLIVETVSYKVDGSVARQLTGANRAYDAAIEAAKQRVPKRQYVTVKPL